MALGVDKIAGGGGGGAAWVLRIGTVIYLAATHPGPAAARPGRRARPRLSSRTGYGRPYRRAPTAARCRRRQRQRRDAAARPGGATGQTAPRWSDPNGGRHRRSGGHGGTRPVRERRLLRLPKVGPVVGEAMRANAAIRVFYGFMLFFLAFILRSEHFGHTSDKVALGGLAVAIAAGGMLGTGIGSALKSRAPQAMMFTVIGIATLVSTACAILFGLWSVLVGRARGRDQPDAGESGARLDPAARDPGRDAVVDVRLLRDAAPAGARRRRPASACCCR